MYHERMKLRKDAYSKKLDNVTSRCYFANGFATRIKNIVSCHRIANNVQVYWDANCKPFYYKKLNEYFPDLVETDEYVSKTWRQGWRLATFPGEIGEGFSNKDAIFEEFDSPIVIPSHGKGRCIDYEYHRIPQPIIDDYLKIFSELRIKDSFLETADKFAKENFNSETVSVHIRNWVDFAPRGKMHTLSPFIDLMAEHPTSKFFVSTDSPNNIKILKETFGDDRIISYCGTDPSFDVFIDLLLLSKNRNLIGSVMSTFSEVAWWLGGATAKVKIAYGPKTMKYMYPKHHI